MQNARKQGNLLMTKANKKVFSAALSLRQSSMPAKTLQPVWRDIDFLSDWWLADGFPVTSGPV